MPGPPYRVDIAPAAARQLRRLPPGEAARLRGPIHALGLEPRPPGATRLVGSEWWRLRVGDLRLIYAVDDARNLVVILRAARRNERTYRPGQEGLRRARHASLSLRGTALGLTEVPSID
jgi:mRNA interferase RelE/StbE